MKLNYFKRNLAILAAAAITVCTLAGCGSSGSSSASGGSTEAPAAASSGSTETSKAGSTSDSSSSASSGTSDANAASSSSTASSDASTSASSGSSDASEGTTQIDPDKELTVKGEDATSVKSTATESEGTDYAIHSAALENICDDEGNQPQIVVFGDSQFDSVRDQNGLGTKIAYYTHSVVYNCAIGGTSASVSKNNANVYPYDGWQDTCFVGMAYAATGQVDSSFMSNHYAYNVFKQCDFSQTDVFVIEYGVNDFLSEAGLNEDGNFHAYLGAMKQGIYTLKNKYPNAKIVVCSPTYAQFFNGDTYVGDSNMLSNGYGTLSQYAGSAANLADQLGVEKFDAYTWLNWNAGNCDQYLEDGIHMNEEGRKQYANWLARRILIALGYNTETGTDLTTFDMTTLVKETK